MTVENSRRFRGARQHATKERHEQLRAALAVDQVGANDKVKVLRVQQMALLVRLVAFVGGVVDQRCPVEFDRLHGAATRRQCFAVERDVASQVLHAGRLLAELC